VGLGTELNELETICFGKASGAIPKAAPVIHATFFRWTHATAQESSMHGHGRVAEVVRVAEMGLASTAFLLAACSSFAALMRARSFW
jgi:hypothetical protein